jgi:chloride channel protein, CIC family
VVEAQAPCADKRVSEVQWPRDSVIATLRRGQRVIIPHGDTLLKPGDVLVIAVEGEAREAVQRLCSADQTISALATGTPDKSTAPL